MLKGAQLMAKAILSQHGLGIFNWTSHRYLYLYNIIQSLLYTYNRANGRFFPQDL